MYAPDTKTTVSAANAAMKSAMRWRTRVGGVASRGFSVLAMIYLLSGRGFGFNLWRPQCEELLNCAAELPLGGPAVTKRPALQHDPGRKEQACLKRNPRALD